jgi:hypothetical protein
MTTTESEKAIRTPNGIEVWETTIPGAVWVTVANRRGEERQVKVGPNKGARLRIKVEDREYTQDRILHEASDVFSNGTLRRIDNLTKDQADVEQDLANGHYTEAVLAHVLTFDQGEFEQAVLAMNERGVRSLKAYALGHDARVSQLEFIQSEIDEKYKIEAVMPSTAEIIEAEQRGEQDI